MSARTITAPVIALDVMGGDASIADVLAAAEIASERYPKLSFSLHGPEAAIRAELARCPRLSKTAVVVDSDDVILGTEKPSQALRRSKTSTMGMAIQAVKAGTAHAAVSSGNTGALMAMALFALRTMEGIDRPALAALLPTLKNDSVVLDLGANTECDAENLVQFAVMGAAFARTVLGLERPRVALLNIGEEELKGTEEIKDAAHLLRGADLPIEFAGFVEGDKIGQGNVDVIVTDGFSGNIALKTAEGTGKLVTGLLAQAFQSSWLTRLGYLMSRGALRALRAHLDPNAHNGAVFLGLNGIVVKSHGSANVRGIANAIGVAHDLIVDNVGDRIASDLQFFREHRPISRPSPRNDGGPVIRARIIGTGGYLPTNVLSNADLAARVDTTDEWIVERTGIRRRHIAAEGEFTSDLGTAAAQRALEAAGMTAAEIDLIVVATATPDQTFPACATVIQHKLGMTHGVAFDVGAVCSGFLYALSVADALLTSGAHRTALVIGAETFSRILDWEDRATCVLFGDGAGAVVLRAEDGAGTSADRGILAHRLHSDGRYNELLYVDGGPGSTGTTGKLRMRGKEVFRHAVTNLANVMTETLTAAGLQAADVDWVIPHQANLRILEGTARKLGLPMERVVVTVGDHANTSAASVPLALDTAVRDGRIKPHDLLILEAMGGGFTWGAAAVRW